MLKAPSIVPDSDESVVENSTAPTTPDGSLTFSPILHAANLGDAFDGATPGKSLSASLDLDENLPINVKNICCVGAGYVGGPTSAVIAFQNPSIRVNVVDRDPNRIASWNSRHLPIHENGLSEIVRIARDGSNACSFINIPTNASPEECSPHEDEGVYPKDEIAVPARQPNIFFSTQVAECIGEADIIFITVNTPTKTRGMGAGAATDMTALEGATKEIALHARPGAILVEKSTVPCGTSQLIQETLQIYRPGVQFEVLSNPEFLAEGTAVKNLLSPDRVIIGSADTISGRRAAAILASVYAAWVPRSRIATINVWSSELSKLVANAMLAQRISSINSISAICEKTGGNVEEIALSVGLDSRIGPHYLRSGLGFGGSCFKKDILSLIYLAQSLGLCEVGEYWKQVLSFNDFQRKRFAQRVIQRLNNTLVRKKITLLGYAFKKNTSDTRESPAIDVIQTLLSDCPAEIAIFDPCCNPDTIRGEVQKLLGNANEWLLKSKGGPVEIYTDAYAACVDSNAVLILTEWDEFRNIPNPSSRSGSQMKNRKTPISDPRPFSTQEPSESDLLTLHEYLSFLYTNVKPALLSASTATIRAIPDTSNPLSRYIAEPPCPQSCRECAQDAVAYSKVGEALDWQRIAGSLRSPKWVFDGRGILNVPEMEKLGIRVESIGKTRK